MAHEINGIPVTAPLWQRAKPDDLFQIIKHLSDASYHFADDSGREWSKARECLRCAASEINGFWLGYRAISCLVSHTSQLVTLDQVFDAVLRDARMRASAATARANEAQS